VVSAAPVGTVPSSGRPNPPKHDPGERVSSCGIWGAPLTSAVFRAHYADLALMEDILQDSGLDWTISRAAETDRQAPDWRLPDGVRAQHPGRLVVSRADVAHHMLRVLDQNRNDQACIGIAH